MNADNEISRHAVVLLHGLCGTSAELGSIPKALTQMGYAVSSLEIPGYSAGLVDPAVTPHWEEWCDTVDAEVSRLGELHESVSICGLSMGATLALATSIRRKDILVVVALSPILRYDGWSIRWYEPLLKIAYLLGFKNWSYKESEPFGLKNIEMRRRVAKAFEQESTSEIGSAAIPARQLYAAQKMMGYVRKSLAGIESRILVIHAIDDESAAPRNAEIIIKRVSSEVRKIVWLGDCYHIITFDNEREIVANETVRFINKSVHAHEDDLSHRRFGKRSKLRDRR